MISCTRVHPWSATQHVLSGEHTHTENKSINVRNLLPVCHLNTCWSSPLSRCLCPDKQPRIQAPLNLHVHDLIIREVLFLS